MNKEGLQKVYDALAEVDQAIADTLSPSPDAIFEGGEGSAHLAFVTIGPIAVAGTAPMLNQLYHRSLLADSASRRPAAGAPQLAVESVTQDEGHMVLMLRDTREIRNFRRGV